MPIKCDFLFERSALIYYTDEQIVGTLRLTTTKPIQIEALAISFVGGCEVSWSEYDKSTISSIEHNDSTKSRQKTTYSGEETYHNETSIMSENATLAAGSSLQATFYFNVPSNLPASYKYAYGQIAYKLCVKLKRKTKGSKMYTKNICIKRKLDLRGDMHLLCTCSSVKRNFKLALPQTGYMPGQTLPFSLSNALTTLDHCLHAKVMLKQCTCYCSQVPTEQVKNVIKCLAAVECQAINLFGTHYGSLAIPLAAAISSDATSQHLLKISYFLEAQIYDAKLRIIEKLKLPIVIATNVPMHSQRGSEVSSEEKLFCYDNMAVAADSVENLCNVSYSGNYEKLASQEVSMHHSDRKKLLKIH